MQVIKRDGRAVSYDRSKIIVAIQKANAEVEDCEKISEEKIEEIIDGIEAKNRKRMLVEDIQDIIEQKILPADWRCADAESEENDAQPDGNPA